MVLVYNAVGIKTMTYCVGPIGGAIRTDIWNPGNLLQYSVGHWSKSTAIELVHKSVSWLDMHLY